jgi:hypothetical protein
MNLIFDALELNLQNKVYQIWILLHFQFLKKTLKIEQFIANRTLEFTTWIVKILIID